jgi:hypothetical protein
VSKKSSQSVWELIIRKAVELDGMYIK